MQCDGKDCPNSATHRIRVKTGDTIHGQFNLCDEHARLVQEAAYEACPDAKITKPGKIHVDEDGNEEITYYN